MRMLVFTHKKNADLVKRDISEALAKNSCKEPDYVFVSDYRVALERLTRESFDFVFGDLNDIYHHDCRNLGRFFQQIPEGSERPVVILISPYKVDSRFVTAAKASALYWTGGYDSRQESLDKIVRLYILQKQGRLE